MKKLLTSWLVWLLLLALPFQGVAAATMLPCAPPSVSSLVVKAAPPMEMHAPHDHQNMLAAQVAKAADQSGAPHHDGSNCKSCAACCPANLMVSDIVILADSPHFATAPFITGFVPVVDLALPERPPQALPA